MLSLQSAPSTCKTYNPQKKKKRKNKARKKPQTQGKEKRTSITCLHNSSCLSILLVSAFQEQLQDNDRETEVIRPQPISHIRVSSKQKRAKRCEATSEK